MIPIWLGLEHGLFLIGCFRRIIRQHWQEGAIVTGPEMGMGVSAVAGLLPVLKYLIKIIHRRPHKTM